MSSRCYDANISSLWKNVWHNGDLKGGCAFILFCVFPPFLFLFLDVNKSVY